MSSTPDEKNSAPLVEPDDETASSVGEAGSQTTGAPAAQSDKGTHSGKYWLPRLLLKLGLCLLIAVIVNNLWTRAVPEFNPQNDGARVIAASLRVEGTEITTASLWAEIDPALPGTRSPSFVQFPISAHTVENEPVTGIWAVSQDVGTVYNCPSVDKIDRNVPFDKLPIALKQALTTVSSAGLPDPGTDPDFITARENALYAVVSVEISSAGQEIAGDSSVSFVDEANIQCQINLTSPWYAAGDDAVFIAPQGAFAFPAGTGSSYSAELSTISANGAFYYDKGTFDPQTSDAGSGTWTSKSRGMGTSAVDSYDVYGTDSYYIRMGSDQYTSNHQLTLLGLGVLGGLVGSVIYSLHKEVRDAWTSLSTKTRRRKPAR